VICYIYNTKINNKFRSLVNKAGLVGLTPENIGLPKQASLTGFLER